MPDPKETASISLQMIDSHGVPLTGWLPAATPPVHAGVYLREAPAGPYACWDGLRWRADAATPQAAASQSGRSSRPRARWRGLSVAPDAPCLTCKGHTVVDHGVDPHSETDLITECPDC